jgi:hypothetical protein
MLLTDGLEEWGLTMVAEASRLMDAWTNVLEKK